VITPSDKEYKETKRIKRGEARLEVPFDELARWIASEWRVTVLNVIYDRRNSLHAPRLQIILEHQEDVARFRSGVSFDQQKEQAIKARFLEIIGRDDAGRFDVDGLFIFFSAFAPLARQDADNQISDKAIRDLKAQIGNSDLWEISRRFGSVTFFFFTDAQRRRYEAEGKRAEYARFYFDLLNPHDEFGHLDEKEYTVAFDSKENFDKNYEGNWFYYYR
jgi:hypothetical protein